MNIPPSVSPATDTSAVQRSLDSQSRHSHCVTICYRAQNGYHILDIYPGVAVLVAVATELVWTTELGNPVYCVGPGTT